ncbi:MAG: hypothetical protein DYG98_17315 [Haliscomenobacteraceae bacterium CHB4]|nr:hypothetical protein [Saprospiraceae bacterium]MCE7924812.1 hypothetical protein [Haliscomenobacteraceae bacterium CHB4]
MNTFVRFSELTELSGRKTRFYTVRFEQKTHTEFEDFLLRHENRKDLEEQLNELIAWLDEIAERRGALNWLFRQENKAHALPPKQRLDHLEVNNLRLYCLRLSDHVVILFNGGVKTADVAQNCPNVKPYFVQANRLAGAIDESLQIDELRITDNGTRLAYPQNFELIL